MDVAQYALYGVPAITLVMASVKVARETGLPSKYAPTTSIGLGVLSGIGIALQNGSSMVGGVVAGIMIGVSASGIYDVAKKSTDNAQIGS